MTLIISPETAVKLKTNADPEVMRLNMVKHPGHEPIVEGIKGAARILATNPFIDEVVPPFAARFSSQRDIILINPDNLLNLATMPAKQFERALPFAYREVANHITGRSEVDLRLKLLGLTSGEALERYPFRSQDGQRLNLVFRRVAAGRDSIFSWTVSRQVPNHALYQLLATQTLGGRTNG